jgi:hypothetical protein
MLLAHYLGLLHRAELELAKAYREVADHHGDEPDIHSTCQYLAGQCDQHAEQLQPFVERYGETAEKEPERLHSELFRGSREGSFGMLRDLHDLYLMACESDISWTLIGQAAQGARDNDLFQTVSSCETETAKQLRWLTTRMKQAAPQVLLVADQ